MPFYMAWPWIWPSVLEALILTALLAATAIATRYATNCQWRADLAKNMPANVREQLALRDQEIQRMDTELRSLRRIAQEQDAALRAVRQITWQTTFHASPEINPPMYAQHDRRQAR